MRHWIFGAAVSLTCGCYAIAPETDTDPSETGTEACSEANGDDPAATSCAPGVLDPTFGGDGTGIVRLSIKPDDAGGVRAFDFSGKKILVAGDGVGGLGGSTFKVARLREDGTPDANFAMGKVVRTQWGSSTGDYAFVRGVGRQTGGRVVAIGTFDDFVSQDVALARYRSDGSLDTTFGTDGKPLIDLGGSEVIQAGVVLANNRILAAGARDGQVVIARFTQDGALDTSFAPPNGYVTTELGDESSVSSLAVDCTGHIVAAGTLEVAGQTDMFLLRLTAAGALDTSFGTSGHVIAGDMDRDERAVAVAVTSGRRYVIAGDAGAVGGGGGDFQVRRFRASGAVDSTFGSEGVATATLATEKARAEGMALSREGDVVMVGNTTMGSSPGPIAVRFTTAGAPEPSFGTGGVLPLDLGDFGQVFTIRVDSADRALIGGGDEGASPGPGTFLVVERMCL